MAALERLFMEIFDGRARIEGQLRQQADAYTDSLATNLLAEDRRLPVWLWPRGQQKELSKEEFISGLSFPVQGAITPVKRSSLFTIPSLKADTIYQYNGINFNKDDIENTLEMGPSNDPIEYKQDCHVIEESDASKCGPECISQLKGLLTDECTTGSHFNTVNLCNDPKNDGLCSQMIENPQEKVTDADEDADSMFHSNGLDNETCTSIRCFEMEDVSEAGPSSYFNNIVQDSPLMDEPVQKHAESISDSIFQLNGLFTHSLSRDVNTGNRFEAELAEHLKDGEQDSHMVEVSKVANSELEADSNLKSSGLLLETCMPDRYFKADNGSEVSVDTPTLGKLGTAEALAVSEVTKKAESSNLVSDAHALNTEICTEAGPSNFLSDGTHDSYVLEENSKKVHYDSEPPSQYSRRRQRRLEVCQDKKVGFINLLDKEYSGHASAGITKSMPTSLDIRSGQKNDRVIRSACGTLYYNVVDRAQEIEQSVSPSPINNVHISPGDTVPELEGFRIDFPVVHDKRLIRYSVVPSFAEERLSLHEQLGRSRTALSPVFRPSTRHKINEIPEAYRFLPAESFKEDSLLSSFQFDDASIASGANKDGNFSGFCCDMQTNLAGSYLERMHSQSLPASSLSAVPIGKPPLTPPVEKVGPGRSVSSEHLISKHVCFRIDESSITTEEDCFLEKEVNHEKDGHMFDKGLNDRKPLGDVTLFYQNSPAMTNTSIERLSFDSVCTDFTNACNFARITAESLSSRSSKCEFSRKEKRGSKHRIVSGKGDKPSNIVSSISSFIPLVRQQQQAIAPFAGKRNIKVKALEAAEATKRAEEKKLIEREMRKAALKVERENARQLALKQKRINEIKKKEAEAAKRLVLKQKEIDVLKKKDLEAAARKRQRGEEEKKIKENKRRCLEEVRNQQKEGDSVHSEKAKELQQVPAVAEQRRNLTDNLNCCNNPKGTEPTESKKNEGQHVNNSHHGSNHDALDAGKVVVNPDGLQSRVQDRLSFIKGSHDRRSYEISPYRDSDDEDGDEDRRKKKYVPLWARRECLEKILLSMQGRDPAHIFARKSSFNLGQVLSPRLHRQIM